LDEYRVEFGIVDKYIISQMYFAVAFSMFVLAFTNIYTYKVLLKKSSEILSENTRADTSFLPLFFAFLFSVYSIFSFTSQIESIAFFVLFSDGVGQSQLARSSMSNDSSIFGYYSFVFNYILLFVTLSYQKLSLTTNNKIYSYLFILSMLASVFTAIMTTEKAPIIWLFFAIYVNYCLIRNNAKLPSKKILIASTFFFFLLVLLHIQFYGYSFDKSVYAVISRAFSGSIQPLYSYIEIFPQQLDFLYGQSLPNPGGLLPFEPFVLTVEVNNIVNPADVKRGVVGSMPTIYVGEAYANFGIIGVLILPFVISFLILFYEILIRSAKRFYFTSSVYILLILHIKNLSITGYSDYIFDVRAVKFFLFIFSFYLVSKLLYACTSLKSYRHYGRLKNS
jgi:oligosaccharide repeat unit polymerase